MVAGSVLESFPVLNLRLRRDASPLKQVTEIIVRAGIIRVDFQCLAESILRRLIFLGA